MCVYVCVRVCVCACVVFPPADGAGGPSPVPFPDDFGKMWGEKARQRIDDTCTLIVDEVSMISGDFFTQLERMCRVVRLQKGRTGPFGGIQVVVTGDFLQVRAWRCWRRLGRVCYMSLSAISRPV